MSLSGTTSTIGFTGTLANLDNWSVSLASSGLTIPGITTSPVVFSGTLRMTNGVPSLSLRGAPARSRSVISASPALRSTLAASPATGVSRFGPGLVQGRPEHREWHRQRAFDKAGALVSAKADIQAHLVGTQVGGKKIDLTGTVKLDGNRTRPRSPSPARGIVGDLIVNPASGSLTLATNKAQSASSTCQQGPNMVRFNGSIVWDGITAYTPFLPLAG